MEGEEVLRIVRYPDGIYNVYINGAAEPINYHIKVLRSFKEAINFCMKALEEKDEPTEMLEGADTHIFGKYSAAE